ncbi:MAG: prepilin-type N-terminal cleavage/methylation domain-containing protein [Desulfobacteraceae bacterium]
MGIFPPVADLYLKYRFRTNSLKRRGFTLIELMVVMLLISIILAVAIPRFDSMPFQDPGKKLSRWMINAVRFLRATAIQKHTLQVLVVDLGEQRMWMAHEGMSEEEKSAAAEKAFSLSGSIRIVDAQYPDQERINTGTIDIQFYPAGYSDQVILHLENEDAQRISYLIEPLLPKLKIVEEWIEF